MTSEEVDARINSFKEDLPRLSSLQMVRKHITFGSVAAMKEEFYFDLKDLIAGHFAIHPSQVIIVGSGKLGFSIAENQKANPPKKRYRCFSDSSDIDIAIVESSLFDEIWIEVQNYSDDIGLWNNFQHFTTYLFRGWIRPDKLPPSYTFELAKDWWEFFRELTSSRKFGPYKLTAGLYKSWYHLEKYQMQAINQCKEI
ncbi:MAG: hypothetical protein WA958_07230 [Tunicatimonas sp.]